VPPFERLADESVCYLTTTGRVSGRPHTIEIWFALQGGVLYLLSGGGDRADWVKNIRKDRGVRIRVGSRTVGAKARIVRGGTKEDAAARELLDGKYMGWREGKRLSSWARGALPVAVDLAGTER
jgi:deazaflavin-dependent oxidoreductase (nitroreductase family)